MNQQDKISILSRYRIRFLTYPNVTSLILPRKSAIYKKIYEIIAAFTGLTDFGM